MLDSVRMHLSSTRAAPRWVNIDAVPPFLQGRRTNSAYASIERASLFKVADAPCAGRSVLVRRPGPTRGTDTLWRGASGRPDVLLKLDQEHPSIGLSRSATGRLPTRPPRNDILP